MPWVSPPKSPLELANKDYGHSFLGPYDGNTCPACGMKWQTWNLPTTSKIRCDEWKRYDEMWTRNIRIHR